jgi:hypothetical protein
MVRRVVVARKTSRTTAVAPTNLSGTISSRVIKTRNRFTGFLIGDAVLKDSLIIQNLSLPAAAGGCSPKAPRLAPVEGL